MTHISHRLPGEGETQPNSSHGVTAVGEYPAHGTGAARLLAFLLLGREVGPLDAWLHLGSYRLADVKFRLRKAGWPVVRKTMQRPNKFGESCAFALYCLPDTCVEAAGEDGRKFALEEVLLMDELMNSRRGH